MPHARSVVASFALAIVATSAPARADDATLWRWALTTAEILTPDFRFELRPNAGPRWVASWPVAPVMLVNARWAEVQLALTPFIEPQYIPIDRRWRALAGGRLSTLLRG